MDSRPLTDSVDFFVVPLVGVLFGYHDVEIQYSSAESVNSLPEFMGNEFGHFGLIDEKLFELVKVIIVKNSNDFLEL